MKNLITLAVILLSTSIISAQQVDDIIGKYQLPNKLDVEIFKQKGKYFGKIIALHNFEYGQIKDINNPEESKHNTLLIGKIIIKNLEFDKETKEWINGTIYSPDKGFTLNFKISDCRKTEIEVVASKYFFWKTLVWKKI